MLSSRGMKSAYFKITLAYLAAGAAALLLGGWIGPGHPLLVVALADLAGTLVIFAFSLVYNNSSFYDPYWSLAPVLIAGYWLLSGLSVGAVGLRQGVVMALVLVWALRLTLNWAVRWQGVGHEDWRYRDLREVHGKGYWLVSFTGIHLMPTVLVFLGCLSLQPALAGPGRAFWALDLGAALVTAAAIWIEARADVEVTRFAKTKNGKTRLLQSGIWSLSRHPNYFGEITFWWGLYLFALAADPSYGWTLIGPLAITALFVFVSIPLIEKRMLARRPGYRNYQQSTSILIPWFRKKKTG
ncbi:MAG: DUF1295 domain-containing protein [Anaerolineales bacterium]|nr:DUF1295 domain-containing protein [Anaerolineales bacterium]